MTKQKKILGSAKQNIPDFKDIFSLLLKAPKEHLAETIAYTFIVIAFMTLIIFLFTWFSKIAIQKADQAISGCFAYVIILLCIMVAMIILVRFLARKKFI